MPIPPKQVRRSLALLCGRDRRETRTLPCPSPVPQWRLRDAAQTVAASATTLRRVADRFSEIRANPRGSLRPGIRATEPKPIRPRQGYVPASHEGNALRDRRESAVHDGPVLAGWEELSRGDRAFPRGCLRLSL